MCRNWMTACMTLVGLLLGPTARATVIYVTTNGDDTASGLSTAEALATIQEGIDRAQRGDTVIVRGGVYRQYIECDRRKTEGAGPFIEVHAYSNETVTIKGSDVAQNWGWLSGSIWRVRHWPVNSQQVFVDGAPLREIGSPNDYIASKPDIFEVQGYGVPDMTNGTFFYDRIEKNLYVWLEDGSSPSDHLVEASTRLTGAIITGYYDVSGLDFAHCNSVGHTLQGWPIVALGPNCRLTDCRVEWGDAAGLSGHHNTVVSNCFIGHNGSLGYSVSWTTNSLLIDCMVISNHYRGFMDQWGAGGIKCIPNAGARVESCEVAWNHGPGIWFDTCRSGEPIVIRRNRIHHNGPFPGQGDYPAAIFIEISSNAWIYDNLVEANHGVGAYIGGSDRVRLFNNLFISNSGVYEIQMAGVPRDLGASGWASLTDNTICNNMIVDSQAGYLFAGYTETDMSSTRRIMRNRLDFNSYDMLNGVPTLNGTDTNTGLGFSTTSFQEWMQRTGCDAHSLTAAPQWSGESGALYRPNSNSVTIDAGSDWLTEPDYTGVPRPLDGNADGTNTADIGPYEYANPRADSDRDGINDSAEVGSRLNPINPDTDDDAQSDGEEWIAGTDSLSATSRFEAAAIGAQEAGLVIAWEGASNRTYALWRASNSVVTFDPLATNLPAVLPTTRYTDDVTGVQRAFYRIGVQHGSAR
jgi:hypothetical protein